MQQEWRIWFGFTAVVILAVMFVQGRGDGDKDIRSQLSAGTSSTAQAAPSTTATTVRRTTTSSSTTSTPPSSTTPPTTRRVTPATTPASVPNTVADTTPPVTDPPTTPPTTQPPPRIQFGPGTYRIGIDLPAGVYRTDGSGQSCFWARLSSLSGSADSVIAGEHTNGSPATVGIDPSDAAFTTAGCAVWLSV